MSEPDHSEFEQLWQKYSKQDLWNHLNAWWDIANRSRIVMVLAMHHNEELDLAFIRERIGESNEYVEDVLDELVRDGNIQCVHSNPKRYRIDDEAAFLRHVKERCLKTAEAAEFMSTLAGWAVDSNE